MREGSGKGQGQGGGMDVGMVMDVEKDASRGSAWELASTGGASSGSDDLEFVCSLPPVFSPNRPGDTLVLVVGSALQQVGSRIGLGELLEHVESEESPLNLTINPPKAVETPAGKEEIGRAVSSSRLKGVQTSPGALCGLAEEETADVRRDAFGRQRSGGLIETRSGTAIRRDQVPQWGLHNLAFGSTLTDGLLAALGGEEEEEKQPLVNHIRELGLPSILLRRMPTALSLANFSTTSLMSLSDGAVAELPDEPGLIRKGLRRRSSRGSGLLFGPQQTTGSNLGLAGLAEESPQDAEMGPERTSILDFEHLFMAYYVEVRPRWGYRCWGWGARGPWRYRRQLRQSASSSSQAKAASVLPSAEEVLEAWKAEAGEYILKHAEVCQLRWQGLRLSRRALARQLDTEVRCKDELAGPRARVVVNLEPERVIHRLLWAIGDAIPPSRLLYEMQRRLQARWPHCRVRCADDFFYPSSVFHAVLFFFTIALAASIRILVLAVHAVVAAQALPTRGHGHRGHRQAHLEPTREERLDQLAARTLLMGSLAHLWMFHAMAASFPLRSLHSPFRRDLGCLAAYSSTASMILRTVGPLAATAIPVAMAIRFDRLGLSLVVPKPGRPVGFHTGALLCSVMLPFLTGLVAWSVRSSLYSHHHLFIVLLFLAHLGTAFGFAANFDMVKWAVYGASANIMGGLFLYFRYTAEFTSARLLKAAQLQWACAHVVPLLGLLLAAALEVESGVARALVDFICENQDIIPTAMCIRILRESDR